MGVREQAKPQDALLRLGLRVSGWLGKCFVDKGMKHELVEVDATGHISFENHLLSERGEVTVFEPNLRGLLGLT